MGLISVPNTFSAGATIIASEHNSNFSTIYDEFNGEITNSNVKSTADIAESKIAFAASGGHDHDGTDGTKVDLSEPNEIGGTTPAAGTFTVLKADTSIEIATGATVTGIADEDDMSSDSATLLATQQSIKKYVDDNASNKQVFTSSGTFTVPAGVTKVYISAVGAGGGAGEGNTGSASGGGGAGGYWVINFPFTVTPSAGLTVTINAGGAGGASGTDGGTTVFDSLTLNGGDGGGPAAPSTPGTGGTNSQTNNFDRQGMPGNDGQTGGAGGGTPFGIGAASVSNDPGNNAAANSGAGGSGGNNSSANDGGNGGSGIVIVEW